MKVEKHKLARKLRKQNKIFAVVICTIGLGKYLEMTSKVNKWLKNITFE